MFTDRKFISHRSFCPVKSVGIRVTCTRWSWTMASRQPRTRSGGRWRRARRHGSAPHQPLPGLQPARPYYPYGAEAHTPPDTRAHMVWWQRSAGARPWRKNGRMALGMAWRKRPHWQNAAAPQFWRPSCHVGEPSRGRVGVGGCPLHQQSPRRAPPQPPSIPSLSRSRQLLLPSSSSSSSSSSWSWTFLFPSLIDHRRQFATPSETRQDWVGLGPLSVAALPNWGADLGDDCCAALRCPALPCIDECRRLQHSLI